MPYDWTENWARIPDTPTGRANGRTHGVCVTSSGAVIVFHQAENGLLAFDPDGKLISATGGDRWLGAHGLTRVVEDDQEVLWLADEKSHEVVKTTLAGEEIQQIGPPDHPAYGEKKYVPTWAAVNPVTRDIWVADGYGASLVHRHAADGSYLGTLDGTEGAGRFNQPHGIAFRTGSDGAELWVTDRGHHRIQIFDGEGRFLRASGSCHSPCAFDFRDGLVLVPELFTGVKLLDMGTLDVVEEIGAHPDIGPNPDPAKWWPPRAPEGWPNLAGTEHVRPGQFNSPHAAAFAPNGDIVVVEWIVGGRITRLRKR